jgi:hypothetical protein
MVHDRLQQEITTEKTNVLEDHYVYTAEYYKNQWYGEVEIVGNSGLSFTNVQAGSGFQVSDQSGITSGIQARFTSNGTYLQTVVSDTTWVPAQTIPNRPVYAYLVFNSGLDAAEGTTARDRLNADGNRFALQARRIEFGGNAELSSIFVDVFPAAVGERNLVSQETNFIPALTDGMYRAVEGTSNKNGLVGSINQANGTTEVGVLSTFEFQLRLSGVFQNTLYSGNLSIGVFNELPSS